MEQLSELQRMDKHIIKQREKQSPNTKIEKGILFVKNKDEWQAAIPDQPAKMLTRETHVLFGHPGRYKRFHLLREVCIFRNMQKTVINMIRTCDLCQRNKPLNYKADGPITAHKPEKILEKVSIDLMDPLPKNRGETQYILAILDIFTKYIKLYAIKKATTKAILNKIENDYEVRKYEELKKAAAEKRRQICNTDIINSHGLASVRQVKKDVDDEARKQNRAKHISIIQWLNEVNAVRQYHNTDWNTLTDWRMVTERTAHRYIPFEQKGVQLSDAISYITENLAKYEKPINARKCVGENTPLWYLSRNALRKALYRASIRRTEMTSN